jgi:hypothetical protein
MVMDEAQGLVLNGDGLHLDPQSAALIFRNQVELMWLLNHLHQRHPKGVHQRCKLRLSSTHKLRFLFLVALTWPLNSYPDSVGCFEPLLDFADHCRSEVSDFGCPSLWI